MFYVEVISTYVYSVVFQQFSEDKKMPAKSIDLIWIVVQDLKKSIKFYTEIVGLELLEIEEEYGWAELGGKEGGIRLGIAQQSEHEQIKPGQNAVPTITVDNLEKAMADFIEKGAKLIGNICEVPGNVKMQMVVDPDKNHFQLVEILSIK